MPPRRCFHFDNHGKPRTSSGCPQGTSCRFVHPTDPAWDTAPVSHPPAYLLQRGRSPPIDQTPREPKASPMRRERSPVPYYKSRRTSSPRRYDRDRRSAESSRRSFDDERTRRPSTDHKMAGHSREGSTHSMASRTDTVPRQSTSGLPPLAPPPSSSGSVAPPPTAPILQPPPPIPAPPPFLTRMAAPAPESTPDEDKRKWLTRTKLLADCVNTRQQFSKIEEDIANHRRLMDTWRAPNLPADGKSKLEAELTRLTTKRDETKKKMEDYIIQLIKSDSWPVTPRSEQEEGEVEKYQEMIKYLTTLNETASEMRATLNDLRERKVSTLNNDAMDVDEGPSSRPLKRRRLSDGEQAATSGPADEDIEAFREKLTSLEGRFSNFENDFTAQDADLRDEFKDQLEAKFEQFAQSSVAAPGQLPEEPYKEVKENLEATGKDVEELAGEISILIIQSDTQEKELAAVRAKLEESNEVLAQLQEQQRRFQERRESDLGKLNALEAALAAYVAQPPSAPKNVPQDHLLHYIEEPVLDLVRATTQPMIEECRTQIQEMLRNHSQELYKTLWGKLALTLRMAETLSQRIDRAENGLQP